VRVEGDFGANGYAAMRQLGDLTGNWIAVDDC
jgi:hypothetical protein